MTISTVAFSKEPENFKAGKEISDQINKTLEGKTANVVILFAASSYDYDELLKVVNDNCKTELIVGCSSAGEFTSDQSGVDAVSAVAIYSDEIQFSAGLSSGISKNRTDVTKSLFKTLKGVDSLSYKYHSALIFADALSGHTDEIIDQLTELTGGTYQFFGGGAGDNGKFEKTHVFLGNKSETDSAVILEILSNKPVGIGFKHGWVPVGKKMRVTEGNGMVIKSLNSIPAVEVFEQYAAETNQDFDRNNPIPFFLHNVIGIETPSGFKVRVPLKVTDDGSIIVASDVPTSGVVSFMTIGAEDATKAAYEAAKIALDNLEGNKPSVALFFDCVATRLRMGTNFGYELEKVKKTLNALNYAGCNTYGQVARVEGQFSGFHNCTAVVCVLPQ